MAKVLWFFQPAVLIIVVKETLAFFIFEEAADLVECGENLSKSTPPKAKAFRTQPETVVLLATENGLMVIKNKVL